MQIDLSGDIAVVTGAAQGNGRAIAECLAKAGAAVALLDIDEAAAETAAEGIRAAGGKAMSCRVDVTNIASCRDAAERVAAELGDVSILVNNAGVLVRDTLDSETFEESWRQTLAVNVDGNMNMVRAILAPLRQSHGRIVNIASITSFAAAARASAYVTSKGAVLQMTKALSIDLAADGTA